jgi:hypothetical protein
MPIRTLRLFETRALTEDSRHASEMNLQNWDNHGTCARFSPSSSANHEDFFNSHGCYRQ